MDDECGGTAQRCIGMGYVTLPPPPAPTSNGDRSALWAPFLAASEGSWEAEVFGKKHRLVTVGLQALYDPTGDRVKADG